MKRFISVILLFTVISAAFGVGFTANADTAGSADRLVLSAEAAEGRPGGELIVTVNIEENPGFMYLRITPQYDSSILTLTNVSKEGAEVEYDGLEYSRNIVVDNSTDITGTGRFLTLTFAVAAEAVSCTTHVGFIVRECFNEAEEEVPFTEPAADAQIAGMKIIIGTAEGVLDGTVRVAVSVENNPGFCVIQFTPSYPRSLTLTGVTSEVASNCSYGTNVIIENGSDITDDGVVAVMTFYIAEDAERGAFEIGARLTGVYNYDEEEINATVESGIVEISCDHHKTEIREAVDASCTEPGYSGDKYCSLCGELLEKGGDINPTGHTYADPEFVWAEDYSTAEAKFVCSGCGDMQSVRATVEVEKTAPTCTVDGEIKYTASAAFGGVVYTDVKTVAIEAEGHKYGDPVFVWFDDYKSATATFSCSECLDVQAFSATVVELKVEPTCTEKGSVTYTATVEFGGETYSDSVSFEIQPKGHSFGEPVFVWSEDNKTAILTCTCASCGEVLTAEATVTEETKVVRENGKALDVTVFTASAEFEGETYTEKKEVVNFIYGDANGDGKVNGQDLIRLRKYLNGENVELNPGANVNGAGNINGQDLIRLRKYLSEGDVSLLGPKP